MEKNCTKCKQVKKLESFFKEKLGKLGYASRCKACRMDMQRTLRKQRPNAYRSWESMKDRCLNKHRPHAHIYYGMYIDPKWMAFEGF